MNAFMHVPGDIYHIMDGVRRAKAAHLCEHLEINGEVVDATGKKLGEGFLPIDSLRSPKKTIRRVSAADETRWNRAVAGASLSPLPYPPITVQPGREKGTKIEDVDFDFGGAP